MVGYKIVPYAEQFTMSGLGNLHAFSVAGCKYEMLFCKMDAWAASSASKQMWVWRFVLRRCAQMRDAASLPTRERPKASRKNIRAGSVFYCILGSRFGKVFGGHFPMVFLKKP